MMEHDTTLEVFDGAKLEECNCVLEANVISITTSTRCCQIIMAVILLF